jgi:hypothetical protein
MLQYRARTLLSRADGSYVPPGDPVELDAATAAALLAVDAIEPITTIVETLDAIDTTPVAPRRRRTTPADA